MELFVCENKTAMIKERYHLHLFVLEEIKFHLLETMFQYLQHIMK